MYNSFLMLDQQIRRRKKKTKRNIYLKEINIILILEVTALCKLKYVSLMSSFSFPGIPLVAPLFSVSCFSFHPFCFEPVSSIKF